MSDDAKAEAVVAEMNAAEDDFTHYFNATGRLSRENADLRARLAEVEAERDELVEWQARARDSLRQEAVQTKRWHDEFADLRARLEVVQAVLRVWAALDHPYVQQMVRELRVAARGEVEATEAWVEIRLLRDRLSRLEELCDEATNAGSFLLQVGAVRAVVLGEGDRPEPPGTYSCCRCCKNGQHSSDHSTRCAKCDAEREE